MTIDHVNVKLFAQSPAPIDLGDVIPVFHRWIQDPTSNKILPDEMLIDVADYRHVPEGPGVLLIGHEANYSLDCAFNELGLLYNRKSAVDGSVQDKLLRSYAAALTAAGRLETEPVFQDKLKFEAGRVDVIINDRLLAPNTDATWAALQPELKLFFDGLFGSGAYTLQHVGEPRERFRVRAQTHQPVAVASLLDTLISA